MISFTLVIAAEVRVRGAFLTSGVVVVVDMAVFLLQIKTYYSKILAFTVTHHCDVQPERVFLNRWMRRKFRKSQKIVRRCFIL
jgi:hypothetical protein